MGEFATVADIAAFLQVQIDDPEQVASANRALAEATAAVRNYTRQFLELVTDEAITLDVQGGTRLFLPQLPVIEVSEVVEDDETLVAGEDYKLGQHGVLHRLGGFRWASGVQIVTVTYSHGYGTLPDAIVSVATRAAARAYQSGLRAAEDEGVIGVASKSLGDFSQSASSEQGFAGQGVMGASAARMLLLSEKDILNEYRV